MYTHKWLIGFAALTLAVAGCAAESSSIAQTDSAEESADELRRAGSVVTIGAADANRKVDLQVGDELRVELAANATTGYSWRAPSTLPSGLKFVSQSYAPTGVGVGGGGVATLRFKATATRTSYGAVTLKYSRARASSSDSSFKFSIKIAAAPPARTCGGLAGLQCPADQQCVLSASHPDASGTCQPRPAIDPQPVGQFCGGIGAIRCPANLTCVLTARHPDAGGTCQVPSAPVAARCGGIAGLLCPDDQECVMSASHPDAMGTCRARPAIDPQPF